MSGGYYRNKRPYNTEEEFLAWIASCDGTIDRSHGLDILTFSVRKLINEIAVIHYF